MVFMTAMMAARVIARLKKSANMAAVAGDPPALNPTKSADESSDPLARSNAL
jgi:hypothetical protein